MTTKLYAIIITILCFATFNSFAQSQPANTIEVPVAGTPYEKFSNALDVLHEIPGVRIVDDQITLFSFSSPSIYINNRLITNIAELSRVSAHRIEKIVASTNPDMQSDNSTTATIRIYLKKLSLNALNIDNELSLSLNEKKAFSALNNLSLNGKKDKLTFGINLQYRNGTTHEMKQELNVNYKTVTSSKAPIAKDANLNILNSKTHKSDIQGSANFTYAFSSNHSISARYEYRHDFLNKKTFLNKHILSYLADDKGNIDYNKPTSDVAYNREQELPKGSHDLHLDYTGKLSTWAINAQFDGYWDSNISNTEEYKLPDYVCTSREQKNTPQHWLKARLVASKNFNNGKFSFGADYKTLKQNILLNDMLLKGEYVDATVSDKVLGIFTELSKKWNKFSLSTILRYERAMAKYRANDDDLTQQYAKEIYGFYPLEFENNGNNFSPTIIASYSLGNTELSAKYNVQFVTPDYRKYILTIAELENPNNLLIQQEYRHIASLSLKWKYLQFVASFQSEINPIYENPRFNGPQTNSIKLDGIFSKSFGLWRPNVMVSFYKQWLEMPTATSRTSFNQPVWDLQFQNVLNLPLGWMATLNFEYVSRGCWHNRYYSASRAYLNASIQKSLCKNHLMLSFKADNIIGTDNDEYIQYPPMAKLTHRSIVQKNLANFTFTAKVHF